MSVKNKSRIIMSGGYHNSNPIKLFVDPRFLQCFSEIYLSDRQKLRLEKHFCGHSDCCCGSFRRATVDKWVNNEAEK